MSLKTAIGEIITSTPIARDWLESRRRQRREKSWSAVREERYRTTRLSIHTTVGLGDLMIARQFGEEFLVHCENYGDPKLGHIVVTAGAWPLSFHIPKGDYNVYWWWSMFGYDDWLSRYLAEVDTKPDVVACLSAWCCDYARQAGATPLYLPLAVGEHFRPMGADRAGIGYAGTKGHKDVDQVAKIIGPFEGDPAFEWASGFSTPQEICAFYNRKQIVLGMTEVFQEKAGMVNNRVFEVLATGTPFILHRHRALEELLETAYPYQSGSAEETRALADDILSDFPKHLERFDRYSRIVAAKHLYKHRFKTLIEFLAGKG